jgi:hypothetical protein
LRSLEYRNERMPDKRISIHADLLNERCKGSGIPFDSLMQADFVLFIADSWQSQIYGNDRYWHRWHPQTLLYIGYKKIFEIFARGESKSYFDKFKCIFGVENKEDFLPMIDAFKQEKLRVPKWGFNTFSPVSLMGYEKLCTRK